MVMNQLWQYLDEEKWDELIAYSSSAAGSHDASQPLKYNQHRFPLHSAILNHAPDRVVVSILKAFPDATKYKLYGNTPLHLVIKEHYSFDCIKEITSMYEYGLQGASLS